MKTNHLIMGRGVVIFLCSIALLVSVGKVVAEGASSAVKGKPVVTGKRAVPAGEVQLIRPIVTGSYLPRTVRRYGMVAETCSPVYVIDQEQIQRSGAATLAGVMRATMRR